LIDQKKLAIQNIQHEIKEVERKKVVKRSAERLNLLDRLEK
jgi:hypothetical protein